VAKVMSYRCECGKYKDEANRWLLAMVVPRDGAPPLVSLTVWDEELAEEPNVHPKCGDKCALTWQARELEKLGR
jgi:hypothetical protein